MKNPDKNHRKRYRIISMTTAVASLAMGVFLPIYVVCFWAFFYGISIQGPAQSTPIGVFVATWVLAIIAAITGIVAGVMGLIDYLETKDAKAQWTMGLAAASLMFTMSWLVVLQRSL